MSPELIHVGLVIFFVLLALACLKGSIKSFKYAHIIMDTPCSLIRSAAQGYVELKGVVKPLVKPITAALTGKPCCWYSYLIEEKIVTVNSKGETETTWVNIDSHSSNHLFYIQDDTGRVIIYPAAADVTAKSQDTWRSGSYRFSERRLLVGDDLVALGFFHTCRVGEAPFNAADTETFREKILAKKQKVFAKHGVLRALAKSLSEAPQMHVANLVQEWGVVLSQHDADTCNLLHKKERPFILSSLPEKSLVKSYYWRSAFCTFGFVLFVVVTLFMLTR